MEKMISWQAMVGWFEISRSNPLTLLFYFIIFVCYINLQMNKVEQWRSVWLVTPRTWVRSQVLTPFPYLFSTNVRMQIQRGRRTIHLQDQAVHVANGFNQGFRSQEQDAP